MLIVLRMSKAIFVCPNCGSKENVMFRVGEKPAPMLCPNCGETMCREYKNVSLGDIVSDEMIEIGQKMLYS